MALQCAGRTDADSLMLRVKIRQKLIRSPQYGLSAQCLAYTRLVAVFPVSADPF